MRRPFRSVPVQFIAVVALASACFALPTLGQAIPNAPQPAASQQGASTQITTIRTYSNLVVIDVVVTDSQGNAIRGLKGSDFTLMENSKPQAIRHFEEHTALPASDIQVSAAPKLPPGLFTNKSAVPTNGPVNVLLLDYLNTPLDVQPYARKQLLDYLNKAPAGTRIAIFGLTTKLLMLQGFTSDMAVLKNALISKKGAPQASDILTDAVNGGPLGNTSLSDALANDQPAVEGLGTQEIVDSINRFQALNTTFQQGLRSTYTLGAFDELARYLVGIPGRKNVIWFSGSFPLDVEPNVNEADPNDSVLRNDDQVRQTDNLLTRAQVAVYPVDARGVSIDPSQNFSSDGPAVITSDTGATTATNTMNALNQLASEHLTMQNMAEDTGGQAMINTNDLAKAVGKAIENGSNYYTLTYTPTNTQWDERFRAIKVKVDQPNVKLAYRNGYYAIDPNDRRNSGGAATALTQPTTMSTAMMHGGPDPSEILFKVRIRPSDAAPIEDPLPSNQKNPDPKINVKGPYKEYGVDLVPDPHAVNCRQEASGNRHCSLEIWTFVYNRDGDKLITVSNRLHTVLTPADYTKMLTGGMAFHQEISVPVRGEYYLRTAIHDMVSDKVGAVEIPIVSVARLEPLQALPAGLTDAPSGTSAAPATSSPVANGPAATSTKPGANPVAAPNGTIVAPN